MLTSGTKIVISIAAGMLAAMAVGVTTQEVTEDMLTVILCFGAVTGVILFLWVERPNRLAMKAILHQEAEGSQDALPSHADKLLYDVHDLLGSSRAELAKSAQQVRAERLGVEVLLAALPMPVMIFDEQKCLVWGNDEAKRTLANFDMGVRLFTLLAEPKLPEKVMEMFDTQQAVLCAEIRVDTPELRYYSASLVPLNTLAGRQGLIFLSDQTALRWATERGVNFVADVSHELRTPLTSLTGFLEALSDHDVSGKKSQLAIKTMRQQAFRMQRLVEDLLELSRLDQGSPSGVVELVDLAAVLEQEINAMKKTHKGIEKRLIVEIFAKECLVIGDESRLAQVVQNLLDNAFKYGKKDTEITVSLRVVAREDVSGDIHDNGVSEFLELAVKDRGEGIAAHHLPHLSTRFYRIDRNRSRESGGTGLGLAIVKHIVQNHQGLLRIESTLGEGSCFCVLLPCLVQQSQQDE